MTSKKADDGNTVIEREEDFAKRVNASLSGGLMTIGLSLGMKLGLFDVMAESDVAMTSFEIADKANCKERYVREWLHHMVMCDVVEVDPTGKYFTLPAHRRKPLTDKGSMMRSIGTTFPYLITPHVELVKCFRKDGPSGLPFTSLYPALIELMNSEGNRKDRISSVNMALDGMQELKDKLNSGIRVCDVGCGDGMILFWLAKKFPNSHFVGFELSSDLIQICQTTQSAEKLNNIEFVLQDVTEIAERWKNNFDWILVRDVLHDVPYVNKVLQSLRAVLKADGLMSVIENGISSNLYTASKDDKQKMLGQLLYPISLYHCLAGSMYYPGSDGLGAAVGIEKMAEILKEAGFYIFEQPASVGPYNVHFVCKIHV